MKHFLGGFSFGILFPIFMAIMFSFKDQKTKTIRLKEMIFFGILFGVMAWSFLGCNTGGPSVGDIPTLNSVCKKHKLRCHISIDCGYPERPDIFIYRNRSDTDSMGLLHMTPTELDKVLSALEKP